MATRSFAMLLLAAALIPAGGSRAFGDDDLCREAEARYTAITGKSAADAQPPVVLLYKYAFCPGTIRVKAGTTLRFVNVDRRTSHSFWFKAAGKAESPRFFPEEHVDAVIDLSPGSHDVLCGPHWEHQNMRGVVVVEP